jgi:integrase
MKTKSMHHRVDQFLKYRRDLGYTAPAMAQHLRSFARFAEDHGHSGPPTMDLMRTWVAGKKTARRWTSLRKFCEFCVVEEPNTEIPNKRYGRKARPRVEPFIYTTTQIRALLAAARSLGPVRSRRGFTYATYFGLIAATGMRPGEVMRLADKDIDWKQGTISIRDSKGNRLRIIPVHKSVLSALRRYREIRTTFVTDIEDAPFFIDDRLQKPLNHGRVNEAFRRIRVKAGIDSKPGYRPPRAHDLRHTFACRHLLRICKQTGDAGPALLSLSVYLGHASVRDTYWYLTGTPELFQFAAQRFELSVCQKEGEHEK